MGKLNVRCLLFSTASESRNHCVLLRDHLRTCKPKNAYNDMSRSYGGQKFHRMPSQNLF